MVFPRAKPGCPVFAAKGGIKNGAHKGAVPRQRSGASYLPRAEPGEPVRKAEPIPDRTLGSQSRRPGGAINPRGEAASTFGNTAKRRFPLKSPWHQVSHTAPSFLISSLFLPAIPAKTAQVP